MQPAIGIKDKHLEKIAYALSSVLADEFVLYAKTRNAHWNIEGPDFYGMHTFFESQYEQLDEIMDNVAERIRTIGHYAPGSLQNFLQLTHLTEITREKNDSAGFIRELLADHRAIVTELRGLVSKFAEDWKDTGTSDFITSLMETHEKMAWMLRSHLL